MSIVGGFMVPHPPLIVPDVGRGEEEQIRETSDAYVKVARMIAELAPETIVVSSPHNVMYYDYFNISGGREAKGSLAEFRAPRAAVDLEYDQELVAEICRIADSRKFPAGTLGGRKKELDHATVIPLWFVNREYHKPYRLVRIGLSGLPLEDHYRLGMMIKEAVERLGRRTVYIASGDLSHKLKEYGPYGFDKNGPVYDARIMDVMGRGAFGELFDFDETFCEKAAECGHRSFVMMAGAFDRTGVTAEKLSYQDVTGVGYGICTFVPTGSDETRNFLDLRERAESERLTAKKNSEDPYVRLARLSVETYVKTGRAAKVPSGLPEEMYSGRAGVFVSLHEDGRLRGCIGTISPVRENIAEEIVMNGISACSQDPRFDRVTTEELPRLEYSVDVLSAPEPIDSEDKLDVKRYGVIVTKGARRGLLLPDLDGVDTPAEQISIAKRKAGISESERGVELERFEVVRHL
ncbi:MAG: AmmeMemoRadiSam system protein A [Eubacterium sp.]|jgi:AmmeMemoRadiSam system protein A